MFWVLISLSALLTLALIAALVEQVRANGFLIARVYRASGDTLIPPPTPEAEGRAHVVRFELDQHENRPTYEGDGIQLRSHRWTEPGK